VQAKMETVQKKTLEMHVPLIRDQMFRHGSKHMEDMDEQVPHLAKTHVKSQMSDLVKTHVENHPKTVEREVQMKEPKEVAAKKWLTDDDIRFYKAVAEIAVSFCHMGAIDRPDLLFLNRNADFLCIIVHLIDNVLIAIETAPLIYDLYDKYW
jgi:hypothetical protein